MFRINLLIQRNYYTFVRKNNIDVNNYKMNDRLSQFMRAENLTAAKLAEILQIQPSGISHLLSGRNKPNFDFIARMLRMFPDLNPDWLINGDASMYRQDVSKETNKNYTSDLLSFPITNTQVDAISDLQDINNEVITSKTNVMAEVKLDNQDFANCEPSTSDDPTPIQTTDNPMEKNHSTANDQKVEEKKLSPNINTVEKVLIFYSDRTFTAYDPKN